MKYFSTIFILIIFVLIVNLAVNFIYYELNVWQKYSTNFALFFQFARTLVEMVGDVASTGTFLAGEAVKTAISVPGAACDVVGLTIPSLIPELPSLPIPVSIKVNVGV